MPDVIQIGPFMIKLEWLLLILSGSFGYAVMKWIVKKTDTNGLIPLLDATINASFLMFLSWKLSPVLYNPSMLWTNPLGILVIPGSMYGIWIGFLLAVLYLLRTIRRLKIAWELYADLLSMGLVSMIFIYQLLGWRYGSLTSVAWGISIQNPLFGYHPVNVYTLIVTIPMMVWMYKNRRLIGQGKIVIHFLSYYMIGLMIVSFFEVKVNFIFGLSNVQIVYLLMMFFSFIISVFVTRHKHHGKSDEERNESQHDETGILPSGPGNVTADEIRPEDSSQEKRTILPD